MNLETTSPHTELDRITDVLKILTKNGEMQLTENTTSRDYASRFYKPTTENICVLWKDNQPKAIAFNREIWDIQGEFNTIGVDNEQKCAENLGGTWESRQPKSAMRKGSLFGEWKECV